MTVEFQNQKVTATAKDGKWMVRLKSLKAGGRSLSRSAERTRSNSKTCSSARSGFAAASRICSGSSDRPTMLEAEIASAKYPMIRLFTVPRSEVDAAAKDVKAEWKECSPETVATFSAVGYYFGRDLHKARNVPIGLINNAVGGSPAESWMNAGVLKADEEYRQFAEEYLTQDGAIRKGYGQIQGGLGKGESRRQACTARRRASRGCPRVFITGCSPRSCLTGSKARSGIRANRTLRVLINTAACFPR